MPKQASSASKKAHDAKPASVKGQSKGQSKGQMPVTVVLSAARSTGVLKPLTQAMVDGVIRDVGIHNIPLLINALRARFLPLQLQQQQQQALQQQPLQQQQPQQAQQLQQAPGQPNVVVVTQPNDGLGAGGIIAPLLIMEAMSGAFSHDGGGKKRRPSTAAAAAKSRGK
jgi:hypothetical protein